MIVESNSNSVTSGKWRVWSLSDGYLDMPANLLRDWQDNPVPPASGTDALPLSVNCFALAGRDVAGVLIDCGGGGCAPTVGRLEQTMAEAMIDPASITTLALTHTYQDHVRGVLTPDRRVLFPNLKAIIIPEAAMEDFFAEADLAPFRPLLKPIRSGGQVAERLSAVALPGHAPGHTGYVLAADDDYVLFLGDVVHVPTCSSATQRSVGGYDDDQPAARETRLKVFHDAASAGTWIAGAHLGWPSIGLVVRRGEAHAYKPAIA